MKIWSWRQLMLESDLPATTKHVLMVLSTFINDHGESCFPSQARLSRLTSLTERAIIKHLKFAAESGWIATSKRNKSGQEWAANEYQITTPQGVNDVHLSSHQGVNEVQVRGERRSCEGVNDVHMNIPVEHSNEYSKGQVAKKRHWTRPPIFDFFDQKGITGFIIRGDMARLADDWSPPQEWYDWAMDNFSPPSDRILSELDKFKDYFSGKNCKKPFKKDWCQTWRNWATTAFG